MTTVPPSPLDLADVARLARTALQADALVVVDERHRPPALVLAEGDSADLLAALQDLDASSGRHAAADVRTSLVGRRRVISMPLAVDAMVPIAVLHVMQATDAPVRADEEALIRAFGRHLALALERGPSSGPVERETGVVFRWDDLDRLPEARNEITGAVTEFLRPLTGATAVGITVWDPDRRILHALPGAFGATDGELAASVTGPVTNMRSAGARVFATGQPYLSNRASGDPGILQPYVEIFHINRILSIPLATGNRRIGVLHLVNKDSDFTAADVAATEAVAPHIAMAVELACSTARLVARQRLEGVLTSAAVAIASGRSVEDCLFPAFDDLGSVLAAAVIALVPLDAPPLLRRTGPSDPDLERRLFADARAFGATSTGAFPHRAGDPGWAALHAPVELQGERTAALSVLRLGEPFTADEQEIVTRLASLVALAWATERYQHQLAEIARLRERERIADELHDRVAQILFAAQLGLDAQLERGVVDQPMLVEVRELLTQGDNAIRAVIHQLSVAPAGTSLVRRLHLEVGSVEDEFGVVVHVDLPAEDDLAGLPRPVVEAAVKVAREGMVNAAKHAGPCRISLSAQVRDGELVVVVADDGMHQMGVPEPRHGLTALARVVADAGGLFAVEPGEVGTRARASFPL